MAKHYNWPMLAAITLPFAIVPSRDIGNAQQLPTVRDSAGVQIVESSKPRWTAGTSWTISTTPRMSIGQIDGAPEYLFNRIAGVQQLSDGRIVVGDGGSKEIRVFSSAGRHLQTFGGPGGGPGEFRSIGALWKSRTDTIAATDLPGISLFDPSGRYVRMIALPLAEDRYRASPVGQLANGQILGISGSRGFSVADVGTVIRDSLRFYRYSPSGAELGLITVLPGAARWGLNASGAVSFPYVPFSPEPVWTLSEDNILVGSGGAPEVRVWNSDGKLVRIVRLQKSARRVTNEMKGVLRKQLIESAQDANERRRHETFLAQVPFATELPSYSSILSDSEGNLWLEEYRPDREGVPTWDIVAPNGHWLGAIHTPRGFKAFEIGPDFILGVARDELGIERVQSYALAKR